VDFESPYAHGAIPQLLSPMKHIIFREAILLLWIFWLPPLPGGNAYVVDFESPLLSPMRRLPSPKMQYCYCGWGSVPHCPAALLLTLWTSSPPFLSPTWQRAPIALRQCLCCGLRVLHFCNSRHVPHRPRGNTVFVASPIARWQRLCCGH
jgi:hypothetical protein